MGMGHSAVTTTQITEAKLKSLNLPSYDGFHKFFKDNDLSIEMFAYDAEEMKEDFEGDLSVLEDLITNLCVEFNEKTGLTLFLSYHSSADEGSRYDDVDGYFWELRGVYQRTPAAIENADLIEDISYVVFG